MNTVDILNKEFLTQDFPDESSYSQKLDQYQCAARNYAQMENAIAVLSDLRRNASYLYYGGFSRTLGLEEPSDNRVSSIWEEEIFKLIHPDDLAKKHLQELCFYHFIKRQPKKKRYEYYLASRLRMKNKAGTYIAVLHRMFYIPSPSYQNLWLALCLYHPFVTDMPSACLIINSVNGDVIEMEKQDNTTMLSAREKQVLNLIDKGMMSKEIAERLAISIHTVSRHRQEILNKLQVKNSIEACRVAKDLHLIR